MRAATPAGPGPTCRFAECTCSVHIRERHWIFSLKRLQQIDDLLFAAGAMGLRDNLSLCNNWTMSVLYLQASQVELSDNVAMDDENCSPERMSSIRQSRSSGSMASLRRAFRILNRPQVCANRACIRNSRTKKTYSWRAFAGISMS